MSRTWWLMGYDTPHGNLPDEHETLRDFAREADVSLKTLRRIVLGLPVSTDAIKRVATTMDLSSEELLKLKPKPIPLDEYDSVFLSYGGPDEVFARLLWSELSNRNVEVFFFPESSIPGKKLHRTMSEGVYDYDRVVLVCSEASLNRRGVLNEIELLLTKEAEEGGASLLIPLTIDDFLFVGWQPQHPDVRAQVTSRTISDFRGATTKGTEFDRRFERLLMALRRDPAQPVVARDTP